MAEGPFPVLPASRRRLPFAAGWLGAAACLAVLVAAGWWAWMGVLPAGAADPAQIALGEKVYAEHCASCHGAQLEGQPDWQSPLPNGRMPAPPHDETGHTWHHADPALFGIVKHGLVPPWAPEGHESDMPAFGELLSDEEIRAVLAFIESQWPPEAQEWQETVTQQTAEREP